MESFDDKFTVDNDTIDKFMTRLPFEVKLLDQSILTGDKEARGMQDFALFCWESDIPGNPGI